MDELLELPPLDLPPPPCPNPNAPPPPDGPFVRYGVTDPISLQEPSLSDLEMSDAMRDELEGEFPAETASGMAARQAVLREIERLFSVWTQEQPMDEPAGEEGTANKPQSLVKLTTLGSFRLGVVHPGSDIDTLCIGPPHVKREDFFDSFVERLDQHEDVEECVPIPDAYTPIIKLKMRGVCVDLLFARLAKSLKEGDDPDEVVKDDDVLRDMDEKSVRCMNGLRVADLILELVPNKETFRRTLRFVKFWARRRGIYSNVLGFFGGITWSLLVARICQLFPHCAPNQLVYRFFQVYSAWNWTKPVVLCDIIDPQDVPGMSGFKVWNPIANPSDRQHVMPVITPAFPAMNSTYNATETTKRIMLAEFGRALKRANEVMAKQAPWSKVHMPFPFFAEFPHFLCIEVLAKAEDVFKKFCGWVESKLRHLIMQLETVNGLLIRPNPEAFDISGSTEDWPYGCAMFIGLSVSTEPGPEGEPPPTSVDLRPACHAFVGVIKQWADWDLYKGQYVLRVRRAKDSELPDYVMDPGLVEKPDDEPPPPAPRDGEADGGGGSTGDFAQEPGAEGTASEEHPARTGDAAVQDDEASDSAGAMPDPGGSGASALGAHCLGEGAAPLPAPEMASRESWQSSPPDGLPAGAPRGHGERRGREEDQCTSPGNQAKRRQRQHSDG